MNSSSPCRSRFTRPVFLWALAALATEVGVEWLASRGLGGAAGRLLLLLPLVPALIFLLALVMAVQKMDEMQKRICLESVFAAFTLTLAFTFVSGALERAGMYHAPGSDVGTLMMFLWASSYVVCGWRYR
jgi:hypothetical protein